MPLIECKALDYSGDYHYAPPRVDAVINTDDIQSVVPTDARGSGPFVLVKFRNGEQLVCFGVPDDFKAPEPSQRKPLEPYLKNRANGVDGFYCIARDRPEGFTEFWNAGLSQWTSAGTAYKLR